MFWDVLEIFWIIFGDVLRDVLGLSPGKSMTPPACKNRAEESNRYLPFLVASGAGFLTRDFGSLHS